MRNQFAHILAALTLMAVVAGCASTKTGTQKETATRQWNQARSGVLFGLAKQQYELGNLEQAQKSIDDATKLDPDSTRCLLLAAEIAIEQGQLDVADKSLAHVREVDPKNPEADYLMGIVYQRWEKPELALQCYAQAALKSPDELPYLLAKAEMMVALGKNHEARVMLQERISYFEHSPYIRDTVGLMFMQEHNYSEAARLFREASILANDDLGIREHLSLALYYAGQYRDAIDVLTRLLNDPVYATRADLFAALAECQLQTNHTHEARQNYEQATQLEPNSAPLWLGLGKAALATGDSRRTELCLNHALAIDPTSSEAYLMLGYLRLRADNSTEALAAFRKASALDKADTVSLCMVGYVLEKTGRKSDALQCYAKALKIKPHDDMATQLMASVDLSE